MWTQPEGVDPMGEETGETLEGHYQYMSNHQQMPLAAQPKPTLYVQPSYWALTGQGVSG